MRNMKYLLSVLLFSGCAVGPVVSPDYTGLGNSEVARVLRYSVFTGDVGVNYAISQLVNNKEISESGNVKNKLEELGFSCKSQAITTCIYDGYAKSIVEYPNKIDGEKYITTVHIDIFVTEKSIKVDSRSDKKRY